MGVAHARLAVEAQHLIPVLEGLADVQHLAHVILGDYRAAAGLDADGLHDFSRSLAGLNQPPNLGHVLPPGVREADCIAVIADPLQDRADDFGDGVG